MYTRRLTDRARIVGTLLVCGYLGQASGLHADRPQMIRDRLRAIRLYRQHATEKESTTLQLELDRLKKVMPLPLGFDKRPVYPIQNQESIGSGETIHKPYDTDFDHAPSKHLPSKHAPSIPSEEAPTHFLIPHDEQLYHVHEIIYAFQSKLPELAEQVVPNSAFAVKEVSQFIEEYSEETSRAGVFQLLQLPYDALAKKTEVLYEASKIAPNGTPARVAYTALETKLLEYDNYRDNDKEVFHFVNAAKQAFFGTTARSVARGGSINEKFLAFSLIHMQRYMLLKHENVVYGVLELDDVENGLFGPVAYSEGVTETDGIFVKRYGLRRAGEAALLLWRAYSTVSTIERLLDDGKVPVTEVMGQTQSAGQHTPPSLGGEGDTLPGGGGSNDGR